MKSLAPGLLIAMPQLGDPNFHRSVVLMIECGDDGAMGLVVNRAAPVDLKALAEGHDLTLAPSHAKTPVFVGGPVEPQRGFVLHDSDKVEERHEVLPGLYLSLTMDTLQPLLLDEEVTLRFCLGYSGWGPKQLERELQEGSWLFSEAKAEAILHGAPDELWNDTVRGMGLEPSMLMMGKGLN